MSKRDVDEMDRRVAHMLFLESRNMRSVAEFSAEAAMHLDVDEPLWVEERRAFHAATSAAIMIEDLARRVARTGIPARERRSLEKFMACDKPCSAKAKKGKG
jgi:hypothetical protein